MMKQSILAAVCLAGFTTFAHAEVTPRAGSHDSRVRMAHYVDGQVYRINTTVMKVTSIEFGQDEEIVSIVAGDTEGFQFDAVPGGRAMVVKPMMAGVTTNIIVYTNQRPYYFAVTETNATTHYVVRFQHPNTRSAPPANRQVAATAPYQNYGANRLTEITPREVFDDGTFTYFRFARNAALPAIFRVSDGRERTVNSQTMNDGTIRVSGVSKYWVLRAGDTENTIARLGGSR